MKYATESRGAHAHRSPRVFALHGTQYPVCSLHISHPLQASGGGNQNLIAESPDYVLRRLTPKEAERLQGFPDYWTVPLGSDTARYKALGNSMAVPVIQWIGERIQQETGR